MLVPTDTVHPRHGFYALGWLCFGLGTAHYLIQDSGLASILELLMIGGLSVIVLFTGSELSERSVSRHGQWRALLVGVVIAGSFTLLSFAVWLTWTLGGIDAELSFLLSFATAFGAAVGTRASLYSVESSERLEETEELTKLLRINQRVLRHNLRNELAIALGHLNNVENAGETDDISHDVTVIRERLEALLETSDRTRKIVAIRDSSGTTEHELTSVIEAQIRQVRADHATGTISSTLPAECWVTAHFGLPLAIREALTNAIEHNPDDVSVTVTVECDDRDTVHLTIADTGTGIPDIDTDAISIPEETPLTHSRGLGLWILYWTVQMSEGTIDFEDNDPRGTVVRITLPTASPAP
jgi:signal transduction histidine kinase